jgi:glutamine amidotransferase
VNRVAVVDYGLCNLGSVRRAVEECGATAFITDDPLELASADRIVLPGVGAYGDAMTNLRQRKLDVALTEEVLGQGVPFLGVCLGMQLIADVGMEGGRTEGLGWIRATVAKLEPTPADPRVPHIGWNEVAGVAPCQLLAGLPAAADFYFVHSYHMVCSDRSDVAATTPYCGGFVSAVARDQIYGVQFHPEKSQVHGLRVLRNFLQV